MNIFISWSKPASLVVAELLKDWIKSNLQTSNPWVSSEDIEKGALWFGDISEQLRTTSVGIICITRENKNNPWLIFEAGALAKGIAANRICTILIDIEPHELSAPLNNFNATKLTDSDDMRKLLHTLNTQLEEDRLEDKVVDSSFDAFWPLFKEQFFDATSTESLSEDSEPSRSLEDMMKELLLSSRSLSKRVANMERNNAAFVPRDIRLMDDWPQRKLFDGEPLANTQTNADLRGEASRLTGLLNRIRSSPDSKEVWELLITRAEQLIDEYSSDNVSPKDYRDAAEAITKLKLAMRHDA